MTLESDMRAVQAVQAYNEAVLVYSEPGPFLARADAYLSLLTAIDSAISALRSLRGMAGADKEYHESHLRPWALSKILEMQELKKTIEPPMLTVEDLEQMTG